MRRKWVRLLAPFTLVMGMALSLSLPGRATEAVDLGRKCSLTVVPGSIEGEYLSEDILKANIVIDLYQVAKLEENAAFGHVYDGYVYKLLEPYDQEGTGLLITGEMTKEDWQEQTQKAARLALGVTEEGTFDGTVQKPVETGVPLTGTKVSAMGRISGLDGGLYLLVARWGGTDEETVGYEDVEKYVTVAGEEEGRRIQATALSRECVYTFEPQLISLPGKDPYTDSEGNVTEGNTANPGPWLYDMSVVLKSQVDFRYGSLMIHKNLLEYEASGPTTFVFEVSAAWEDHVNGGGALREWRDVVAMDFTKAEAQFKLIEKLPVGAVVTVKEIYSGASYEPSEEAGQDPLEQTVVIREAEQSVEVFFTNRYDGRHVGGHGITNRFAYDEEESRWIWTSVGADGALGGEGTGAAGPEEESSTP